MIHDILSSRFPKMNIVELTGGYTNTTLLLEGGNSQKITKIYAQTLLDQGRLDQGRRIYKQLGTYLARDVHSIKRDNQNENLPIIMKSIVAVDGLEFIPSEIKSMAKKY